MEKTKFEEVASLVFILGAMSLMTKQPPEEAIKKVAEILEENFDEKPKES